MSRLPVTYLLKTTALVLAVFFLQVNLTAQTMNTDSLRNALASETVDTNRVALMWQLAKAEGLRNPTAAIDVAQQALFLARDIGYTEGESRSLGVLANTLVKIGNYPRALELNFEKLQLEEKRSIPRNMASVLMNIGVVYVMQEEYRSALQYYARADSVIRKNKVEDLEYYIALNTGDAYDRLNISDSAYGYFNRSLALAKAMNDGDLTGTSLTGLGHSYRKLKLNDQALLTYREGIRYLIDAGDDEIFCEATLGLAKLFRQMNLLDSAAHYATLSVSTARADGFLNKELDAAQFLTEHYQQTRRIDSAFAYINYVRNLNDSVNGKSRVRESQVLSSNEQLRQLEVAEQKRVATRQRFQQLQMLLIGIFIPGFFLITLILSRARVHVRAIRALGVLSLLFFFEYLTLLLHPTIANLTHHTPVLEILIFVAIASVLIPVHHRLEHWLINKLLHHRHGQISTHQPPH